VTDESGSLLPRDWHALAPLVDRLLDAPANERDALFAELSGRDPHRRAELELLVADCEREVPLLEGHVVEVFDQLVADESELALPDVLGGRYRIERELGRGGMARVYRAQDLKHSRPVAVKVIRPEFAASLGRERFLREIEIAARLRHPSIMPLFDSGDVDGLLYFVMPYEDGLSLRSRLDRDGRLGTSDAVSILRDVARALAYAHEHGVVHRDVKPDNVLLSGDAAVVTDFGIAKAFSVSLTDADADMLGRAEGVIGTPAYMSPEQAIGDPSIDHRADIYSFGCLAYEVFTGQPPFAGSTTLEMIAVRRTNAPRPTMEGRAEVPAAIARLIEHCLEQDPAARPRNASELVDALGSFAPLDRTRARGRRRVLVVASLLIVVAVGVLGAWFAKTRSGPVTVAILPLLSVGGDSSQLFQAEGFSDDIATALVRVPWIRVMSRQGAVNYSGKREIDPRATGNALGARYIVTGSFQTQTDGLQTLTAQLVSSEDGSLLWADKFDRPPELSVLRDRIVAAICDSLASRSGNSSGCASNARTARHRANNEAYRLYLLGKRELNQRGQDLSASVGHFRRAVAVDTLSTEAWSGLSLALALSPYYQGASPASVAPEAAASAQRALSLDPSLTEPRIAIAVLHGRNLQWEQAEREFKTALSMDPHGVEGRIQYARLLIALSRLPEALSELQKARQDDPASVVVLGLLSATWYLREQFDSALVESDRGMQSDSTNLTLIRFRSLILSAVGRKEEARVLVRRLRPGIPLALYALAVAGDTGAARDGLRLLSAGDPKPLDETARAFAFLGLGDTTAALDALERATDAKAPWPFVASTSGTMFASVRRSDRFRALLTRVGLAAR